ncbi:hypothetical protein SAMN04488542_1431 [Fontibacillus panacisegetis]|uniref:Uncharacterized protein n=1 Tax=Fontibacillus panacisegetis TaxID=670482 RepID=A0A1G7U7Y0_9BACL|nr:hypothetical protein SAMN04488542_1431 [Fontibacillus panacisegetis]
MMLSYNHENTHLVVCEAWWMQGDSLDLNMRVKLTIDFLTNGKKLHFIRK